jgi:hypothetical protein
MDSDNKVPRYTDMGYKYTECAPCIYELKSKNCDYKYLLYSRNSIENLKLKFELDLIYYNEGNKKYSEYLEIVKLGDYDIILIEDCSDCTAYAMEKRLCDIIRAHRLDYINISLYRRTGKELKADMAIEVLYIKKFERLLSGKEKFEVYKKNILSKQ